MTKNTWCPLPWMSVNVRNNGDVRICCNTNTSEGQGIITKPDGSNYNLGVDGIEDFRNSNLMKEVRLDMLDGKYPASCVRCQREDDAGMRSRKEWEKEIWHEHITEESARDNTNIDGSIDTTILPLKYADLRFGNLCNLKCRMCGPTDSSQWYDDQAAVWGVDSYKDSGHTIKLIKNSNGKLKPDVDIYSWYENPEFWNSLEKQIPNITRMYIVGGEPLLIDQHYDFLNKCVDNGRAGNMLIEYNTNITNIPQRAWDLWKHFKTVQIGASIDGVGDINDYIRFPSKWSQIEANLHKLDSADGNFMVWWAATIQAYNLMHLPEMMMWKMNQGFKKINHPYYFKDKPVITPHPLHKPDFLNVKIFPQKSKEYIQSYFNKCKEEYKDKIYSIDFKKPADSSVDLNHISYINFCKTLDNYVKYMNAEDYSGHLPKFWHYTNKLDELRGQSLREVSPITFNLLSL